MKPIKIEVGNWIFTDTDIVIEILNIDSEHDAFYIRQIYPDQVEYETAWHFQHWNKILTNPENTAWKLVSDEKQKLVELLKWKR